MHTYIALLRGINVSGQKKISMAELRIYLAALDFRRVQTYIQSGNIIFEAEATPPNVLERMIGDKIRVEYGFDVVVLVRTPQELADILDHNPFRNDPGKDPDRQYFTLLAQEPAPDRLAMLEKVDYRPEEFILAGRTVYFYTPHGYGRAKMNNNFFEQKLRVAATTRNGKTMAQLLEMAG